MAKKKSTKKAVKKKAPKKVTKKSATKKSATKKSTKKTVKKAAKKAAGNKTVATKASVDAFIKKAPEKYREDSEKLIDIMSAVLKEPPVMWGPSIIGFGSYHYVYDSGREGDFLLVGFSPRASAISLYGISVIADEPGLAEKFGKFTMGKGCVYIKKLDDVHIPTLKKLIKLGAKKTKAHSC
ncbi:MAG: DUF1801 domain-containing protein [Phycisphaerales bacterium]|nr:DUF1801 domain-containing protein [Phycisphaerales bacterium]